MKMNEMGMLYLNWITGRYGYEEGNYSYMLIKMENHRIHSKKTEGSFVSENTIERIIVYTAFQPSRTFLR